MTTVAPSTGQMKWKPQEHWWKKLCHPPCGQSPTRFFKNKRLKTEGLKDWRIEGSRLYLAHHIIILQVLPGKSWDSFVTGTLVYKEGLVSLITTRKKRQPIHHINIAAHWDLQYIHEQFIDGVDQIQGRQQTETIV